MGLAEPMIDLVVAIALVALAGIVLLLRGEEIVFYREPEELTPFRKVCRHCSSQIGMSARKCPQCREWIDPALFLRTGGVFLTAVAGVGLLLLLRLHFSHAPVIAAMLAPYEAAALPALTSLVLSLPWALATCGLVAALLALAFALPLSLSRRNALVGLAAGVGVVAIALELIGFFLPFVLLSASVTPGAS